MDVRTYMVYDVKNVCHKVFFCEYIKKMFKDDAQHNKIYYTEQMPMSQLSFLFIARSLNAS